VANRAGLEALGGQIQQSSRRGGGGRSGRNRSGRSGKPRRTAGQRALRVLIGVVAFIVLIAALGYGYFRYEWGKIQTAACAACASVVGGAPYNVLVVGSDTRVGETAAQAQQFGNATTAGGQRSDTIKIIHVDPQTGTASSLSLPRDTFVDLSGVPSSSGVSTKNKLNAAFASGPNDPNPSGTGANGLVQTIQNTFGIPISHWIVVNFFGLTDAVQALGGVSMKLPYAVRDYGDCNGNGVLGNCTGLNLPASSCATLTGTDALALSRSRHFEWYQNGWQSDYSGDIGRIERQNLVIESVVNKAKSTYNPITAVSFISALTHDVVLDNKLGATALLSLAERYHAFSGSSLKTYILPTAGASYAPYGGEAVQVVQEPAASQMITTFLGAAPNATSTPPLDQYGYPVSTSAGSGTTSPPVTSAAGSGSSTATTAPAAAASTIPAYDPRPC